MRRVVTALIGMVVLLTGCSGGASTEAKGATKSPSPQTLSSPEPRPAAQSCIGAKRSEQEIRFPDSYGGELTGALVGRGRVGVVLAHQSDNDLCSWLPFARTLARNGYAALAFDFAGGLNLDVKAAADELRRRGAKQLFLVGASIGGSSVIVAGARIRPHVAGVISLSGEPVLPTLNAGRVVPHLRVPALFMTPEAESVSARILYKNAGSEDKQVLIFPGSAHGIDLLRPPTGRRAAHAILRFIAEHS